MTEVLAEGHIPLLVTVRVVGVGVNQNVEVEEGSPLAAALEQALPNNTDELQVQVNGETVDPADVNAKEGDTIVVVPPAVKLG